MGFNVQWITNRKLEPLHGYHTKKNLNLQTL